MELVSRPKKRAVRKGKRQARRAPGVALVFALTTIAILTAIAVDFSYNSRVNLELAAQSRDSLRARSLAMSGMNMSRMLLHFQKQLDTATAGAAGQFINQILNMIGVSDMTPAMALAQQCGLTFDPNASTTPATPPTSGATTTASGPTIQLWKLSENFDANTIFTFMNSFPTPADKKASAPPPPRGGIPGSEAEPIEASFGEFSGSFSIKITDEDQKINVARLNGLNMSSGPLATVMQLKPLIDNPQYDFIFDREDKNRDRVNRNDVLTSIKDWIDEDETQTNFDPMMTTKTPFVAGGGDENGPYSRYKPRYKAKNARLDSIQELHMVYGVNDAFMSAFGDRLTVYPDINGKLNINTNDLDQLRSNVLMLLTPNGQNDPRLLNPCFFQVIKALVDSRRRMLPFIGMTAADFVQVLRMMRLDLDPQLVNQLDNRSTTFRIVSTGESGRVKKTLTAVVKYDDGLGQLLYWHEE